MKKALNSIPFWVFMICTVLTLVTFVACTTQPPGCPLPEYSRGDFVMLDNVFIGEVTAVEVDGCGEIFYTLTLNVTDDDGNPIVESRVVEARLSPYEPMCE
jgi:hypothetical protein